MAERKVVVASTSGLHARPAAVFAKAASEQVVAVTIEKEGGSAVPASSVLSLMTLGVKFGEVVVLRAEGEGCELALDVLVKVLETNFDA